MKKKSVLDILSSVVAISALVACSPSTSSSSSVASSSSSSTGSSSSVSVDDEGFSVTSGYDELTQPVTTSDSSTEWSVPVTGASAKEGYVAKSYAGATYSEKADILEKLESWTLDNNVGGIPYYENSSYAMYNDRVSGLFDHEVPGIGWGVGYSTITEPMAAETNEDYKLYYHTWTDQLPSNLNPWNSQGSDVSDAYSMISSTYYDTKPNSSKTGYNWVNSLALTKPIALNENSSTGLATKWRIEVRQDVTYSTLSSKWASKYNGRKINLEDYLTPFLITLIGNNQQYRAADLQAASTGGLVNADKFYADTANLDMVDDWDEIKEIWVKDKVGLTPFKSVDSDGTVHWFLDFNLLAPVNQFNAMYRITNSNYSPVPEEFFKDLRTDAGKTAADGPAVDLWGQDADSVLSTGIYTLQEWQANKLITFKKNTSYYDSDSYNLPGYHEQVLSDSTAAFELFLNGGLDGVSIPAASVAQYKSDPRAKVVSGDTVINLNNNSSDIDTWEKEFGADGIVKPHSADIDWSSKEPDTDVNSNGSFIPANRYVMSNSNFINGLYYSIDRSTYAATKGYTPAQGYLSTAYMIDPENGISWRDSDQGKAVLADRSPDTYGYSRSKAEDYFGEAADEIIADSNGTWKDGDTITLQVFWRSQTEVTNNSSVENYFIDAFNASTAHTEHNLTLAFNNIATADYNDAYDAMLYGETDLGSGAITGNSLDPLGFMSVVSSDQSISGGFTLCWGTDTSVYGGTNPLTYDDLPWSFDALYLASTTGAAVDASGNSITIFQAPESELEYADGVATGSFTYEYPVVEGLDVTFTELVVYSYQTGDVSTDYTVGDAGALSVLSDDGTEVGATVPVSITLEDADNLGYGGTKDKPTGAAYFDFEIHYTAVVGGFSTDSYIDITVPVALS